MSTTNTEQSKPQVRPQIIVKMDVKHTQISSDDVAREYEIGNKLKAQGTLEHLYLEHRDDETLKTVVIILNLKTKDEAVAIVDLLPLKKYFESVEYTTVNNIY